LRSDFKELQILTYKMMKITVIALLILSISVVVFFIIKKNTSKKSIILGKETAYANEKEQDRIKRNDFEGSPTFGLGCA
jgi:hypothetical protein